MNNFAALKMRKIGLHSACNEAAQLKSGVQEADKRCKLVARYSTQPTTS